MLLIKLDEEVFLDGLRKPVIYGTPLACLGVRISYQHVKAPTPISRASPETFSLIMSLSVSSFKAFVAVTIFSE